MERLRIERHIRHLQRELVALTLDQACRNSARYARLMAAIRSERNRLRTLMAGQAA